MLKQKDLPSMPKIDVSAQLALNLITKRQRIQDLQEEAKDIHDQLAESLLKNNRLSIRVDYEGESYTLEVQHIDECEKIKIKKG